MKNKKLFRYLIAAIPIVFILVIIVSLAVSYYYPYHYIKDCLYSNKDEFEQISVHLRNIYTEGDTNIRINEDSNYDEINTILSGLRGQYQNDSEYPVFSSINVYFDSDGDLLFYLRAKNNKIENADGMNNPDIRCYYLVYIDENYDGDSPIKNAKPFWGNWYTWSDDTYSG